MNKNELHHLKLRYNTWVIRIQVPDYAQPFYKKNELLQSTKKKRHELEDAKLLRDQFLASHKLRFNAIKRGEDPAIIKDLDFTPEYWSKLQRDDRSMSRHDPARYGLDEEVSEFNWGAMDEAVKLYVDGGWSAIKKEANAKNLDEHDALQSLDPVAFQKVMEHISIVKGETFGSLLDQYLSTRDIKTLTPKYQDQIKKEITGFADKHPYLSAITKSVVVKFKEDLERKDFGSSTISTRLTILSGYWEYLTLHELINENKANPFKGLKVVKKLVHKREAWTLDEGELLVKGKDLILPSDLLGDLIKLGFLTGCRLKELCSLKESDIRFHGEFSIIDIKEDMTKGSAIRGATPSGVRKIPLTSKMIPIVERLIAHRKDRKSHPENAGKGFLFDTGLDQSGDITKPMGSKFARYKDKLGFPKNTKVAHGFRHTANNLLARENVSSIDRTSLFGWVEGSTKSMADTNYADREFIYKMEQRKEHLEILCDKFWFI